MKNAMRPALAFGLAVLLTPTPTAFADSAKAANGEVPMEPKSGKYRLLCADMNVTGVDSESMGSPRAGYSAVIPMNASPEEALMASAEVIKREQRTMVTASADGSVVGIATARGAALKRCIGEKVAWSKPLELAPTSLTTDASGNIYYAGLTTGSQGTDIVLGKYAASGTKAWEARIGGPGNQHDPVIRVAEATSAIYVMGTSDAALPGQAPNAKGYRFVAKYDAAGKQLWLRQAADLGKPTMPIEVRKRNDGKKYVILGDDSTPSRFDVDPTGNVTVATMPHGALDGKGEKRTIELARMVKLDAAGKKVGSAKVSVTFTQTPEDRRLRKVVTAPDGKAAYLLFGLVVVKVDASGRATWARTFSAAQSGDHSEYSSVSGFVDAAVRGNKLYLLSRHTFEIEDGTSLPYESNLVTILDTERGEPQQFRTYSAQDGETSIQLMPSGAIMIGAVSINMFTRPPAKAFMIEVSDLKAPPERSGMAATTSAAVTATDPVPVDLPEKFESGLVEEMCPQMPVQGLDRDFDVVAKRSQPLTSGGSLDKLLFTADAIKRRDARGLIVGTTGNAIVGAVQDGKTALVRCEKNKYAWSVDVDVALSSLASDRAGNIYYAGTIGLGQDTSIVFGKVTPNGKTAWTKRIEGKGDQSEAELRLSPDGKAVYVLGLSSGALGGQSSSAEGYRFLARYDTTGKQEWLIQSRDFGKPTVSAHKTTGEFDGRPYATLTPDETPSFMDVDAAGNVYVATARAGRSGRAGSSPLATVVKLDARGKQQWSVTAKIGAAELPTLSRVLASPDGKQVFVVAGPFISKLNGEGSQEWTRRLEPPPWQHPNPKMRTGKPEPVRADAALQGGKLYVVLTSKGSPDWGDGVLVVVDVEKGTLQSARTYALIGWASQPTIQIMPNGIIYVLTAHESFDTELEGSLSTLWRLKDVKAALTETNN